MTDFVRHLLSLPEQASTIAPEIDNLHFFVISATMFGSLFVFLIALVFILKYRRTARNSMSRHVRPALWIEAGLVLGLLVLFCGIWVVGYQQFNRIYIAPPNAMEVYVIGKQWMWKFAYPDGASSVGVLYAPVGRPVKLIMTSRDVIHSFYVPQFRVKKDVIPGRYTVLWFEATAIGRYPIRCTEFCGTGHSMMLGEVIILSERDYSTWSGGGHLRAAIADADEGAPSLEGEGRGPVGRPESLAVRGERDAAELGCLRCHSIDGTPHLGPTFAGLFGRTETLVDGRRVHVDEAYLTASMMDPLAMVVAGFQPIMPSYWGRMNPAQTGAIVEYIKSLSPPEPVRVPPAPLPRGTVTP